MFYTTEEKYIRVSELKFKLMKLCFPKICIECNTRSAESTSAKQWFSLRKIPCLPSCSSQTTVPFVSPVYPTLLTPDDVSVSSAPGCNTHAASVVLTAVAISATLAAVEVTDPALDVAVYQSELAELTDPKPSTSTLPVVDPDVLASIVSNAILSEQRIDEPLSPTPYQIVDLIDHPAPDVRIVSHAPVGKLPLKEFTFEEFEANASQIIELIPTLDMLAEQIPAGLFTNDLDRQKRHIQALDHDAQVTVEGFKSFVMNESYTAFTPENTQIPWIDPKIFIVHWTAGGYDDVEHFLRAMGRLRVQYFINKDAEVYSLFASDNEKPSHSLGANDFSQGVEIETGHFDGVNSPLFGYTAQQIVQTVYLAVQFLHRNDLPVDRTTIIGHYAADLIFTNPYYDAHTGVFSQPRIRKFDPPEELMVVIVNKAQALSQALLEESQETLLVSPNSGCLDSPSSAPFVLEDLEQELVCSTVGPSSSKPSTLGRESSSEEVDESKVYPPVGEITDTPAEGLEPVPALPLYDLRSSPLL